MITNTARRAVFCQRMKKISGTVEPRLPMCLMVRKSLRIIVQVPSQYVCHNGVVSAVCGRDMKKIEILNDQAL